MPDLGLVVDTTKSLKERNIPVLKEAKRILKKYENLPKMATLGVVIYRMVFA